MKSRNKLIAGVGGVALVAGIAGMSTFALWSDTEIVDAGTITAGTLDVALIEEDGVEAIRWNDVSPDVPETAIADIDAWRVVPGDVLEMQSDLDVALDGDNLAANLDVAVLENVLVGAGIDTYVTINAVLTDGTDGTLTPEADGSYRFSATENNGGQELGGVKAGATLDGTVDAVAVVTLTFDEATPDQLLQNVALADFADAGVTLTQVRDGEGFIDEGTEG